MKLPAFIILSASLAFGVAARAAAPSAALPEVNHYVYLSELPQPDELVKDAASNGLTIARLDRTSDRVVVTYRYANGDTGTVGYALLSDAGADRVTPRPADSSRPTSEALPATVTTRRTTVVRTAPEVIYVEPRYRYYEPAQDFWLPLSLGLGIGWATGWHGGHYHGGFHGHGGWHR